MKLPSILALACAAIACAPPRLVAPLHHGPAGNAPDEAFRAHPPARPPVTDPRDAVRETKLPNGLRVVLVERHGFPVVASQLLIDRGSLDLDDPGGRAIAEMTYVFGRGGDQSVFEQVAAEAATSGVSLSGGASDDSTWAGARAPSASFDASLGLLARNNVMARLTRMEYARRAAELQQAAPWGQTSLVTVEKAVLFGHEHAYGYRSPERVPISLEKAQALHDALFQPTHAILVVVGDVTPAQVDESAARWLGTWAATRTLPRKTTPPPAQNGPRVVVVKRRDHTDGFASVFARGPDGASDDMEAVEVAAKLLGGAKSSALFEHLRDGAGAVYSIQSPMFIGRVASWLAISATYENSKAIDGAREVLAAIEALRNGRVTDEEIDVARETLLAQWRGSMSTAAGASANYARWIALGKDPAQVGEYPERIARVRKDDLVRVAKAYLDPMALHVAFIGEDRWLDPTPLGMGGAKELELDR